MMILLRRFLVVAVLMFWQGGFLFYASVVVPVAEASLGHTRQGFITRRVTDYLNLAGAVALLPLAWDAAASGDRSRGRRWLRWLCWWGMALGLGGLLWLHGAMNDLLDVEERLVLDRVLFHRRHNAYLWISTVQWACALLYAGLMLGAWREEDRSA